MAQPLQFPSVMPYSTEIPLWMNFRSIHFTSNLGFRAMPAMGHYSSKNCISVPVPDVLTNSSNISYTNNQDTMLTLMYGGGEGEDMADAKAAVRVFGGPESVGGLADLAARKEKAVDMVGGRGLPTDMLNVNMIDQTFMGGTSKIYTYELTLKCKSYGDSISAAKICNAFSSRVWPGLAKQTGAPTGLSRISHPFMWIFWISETPAGFAIPSWLDATPQLCIMRNVQTQRLGNDAGAFAMEKNAGGSYLPILYRISLQFAEIEPSYRQIEGGPAGGSIPVVDKTTNRSSSRGSPPSGSSAP